MMSHTEGNEAFFNSGHLSKTAENYERARGGLKKNTGDLAAVIWGYKTIVNSYSFQVR